MFIFFIYITIAMTSGSETENVTEYYHEHFACEPGSVITAIMDNGSIPVTDECKSWCLMDCNGYRSGNALQKYTALFDGYNETLVLLNNNTFNQIHTLTVEGHIVFAVRGEISSGQCAGDQIFIIDVYTPDEENGCKVYKRIKSVTMKFGYFLVVGKCGSKCHKVNGGIDYVSDGQRV